MNRRGFLRSATGAAAFAAAPAVATIAVANQPRPFLTDAHRIAMRAWAEAVYREARKPVYFVAGRLLPTGHYEAIPVFADGSRGEIDPGFGVIAIG